MKIVFLVGVLLFSFVTADFDAPIFEVSEEMRSVQNDYHGFVDGLVSHNAFKWSNAGTTNGSVNNGVIAAMTANLTAKLESITTPTFRQCDRLSSTCYQCENGAQNVSIASVQTLVVAKLYGQSNNIHDTDSEKLSPLTYTIGSYTTASVETATLACRATPGCFPGSHSQTILGTLQGKRILTFKRVAGAMLIDRINTGAYYSYFSKDEAGVKIYVVNDGEMMVPDSIIESSLTGIFCVSSKRSVTYYTQRGLPLMDDPS